jgi:hypothetical protein
MLPFKQRQSFLGLAECDVELLFLQLLFPSSFSTHFNDVDLVRLVLQWQDQCSCVHAVQLSKHMHHPPSCFARVTDSVRAIQTWCSDRRVRRSDRELQQAILVIRQQVSVCEKAQVDHKKDLRDCNRSLEFYSSKLQYALDAVTHPPATQARLSVPPGSPEEIRFELVARVRSKQRIVARITGTQNAIDALQEEISVLGSNQMNTKTAMVLARSQEYVAAATARSGLTVDRVSDIVYTTLLNREDTEDMNDSLKELGTSTVDEEQVEAEVASMMNRLRLQSETSRPDRPCTVSMPDPPTLGRVSARSVQALV